MTITSADALFESRGRESIISRRNKLVRSLGIQAVGTGIKRVASSMGAYIKERPVIPVTAGTLMMTAGLTLAGIGVMDAGTRIAQQAEGTLYAAVAADHTETPPVQKARLGKSMLPISGGGASFIAGGALTAYGLLTRRRRGAVANEGWEKGLRGTHTQEMRAGLYDIHASADLEADIDPHDYAPELFDLNGILDNEYRPSFIERTEERFGESVVALYRKTADTGHRIIEAIAARRAYVAQVRAEARAAARYNGFATVSVMIERPAIGVPDFTA